MTQTVYEVWETKHHPDKKHIDPEHERKDTLKNYDEALGYARTLANRKLDREQDRRDDEVVNDVYTEEHEWDEQNARRANNSNLPLGRDDTIRYRTRIRYETGGDNLTVTQTIWTYHITANQIPE